MKHLIRDVELIAYLEGQLSKEEIKQLKQRLVDNNELDLLYHLQLSYNKCMTEYANELIGVDDLTIEDNNKHNIDNMSGLMIAADNGDIHITTNID